MPAPNIDASDFWDAFNRDVYSNTAQALLTIFLAGGQVGVAQLPANIQTLLDWDYFNHSAQEFLKIHRLERVKGITDTTRENTIKIVSDWIESGESLPMLTQRLEPILGGLRAERIAVTEVTRAYAAGNVAAWKSSDMVSGKIWMTAVDERVCPICGGYDGMEVMLEGDFRLSAVDLPEGIGKNGDVLNFAPPAHPNCRCWLKPVVSLDSLRDKLTKQLGLG